MAESERALDYRDPEWLAQQLGVDKSTIYRYLQDGTLPGLQLGRKWLVSERQLVEFLDTEARLQTQHRRQEGRVLAAFASSKRVLSDSGGYDKFTERAQQVFSAAQKEAVALNHNYIGTEHLLLGLTQGDGLARTALEHLGAGEREVRAKVLLIVGKGQEQPSDRPPGLTPRAKRAIELGVEEARRLNHSYIGTEHLVLGLIRQGDSVGAKILASMDIDLAAARVEVMRLLTSWRQTGLFWEALTPEDAHSGQGPAEPPEQDP